jgi:hypothetical protein
MARVTRKFWYFNIRTGQVEHGRQSRMTVLLGPYRTREEAQEAYHIAAQRNAAWLKDERLQQAQEHRDQQTDHDGDMPSQHRHSADSEKDAADTASDASERKDHWVPWKEFLDQPASRELDREKHGAPGAPSPVTDIEGDVGSVSDPKDPHSFENQLSRFQRRHREIFGED